MNVSSIIVRAAKESIGSVMIDINAIDRCEVHFFDPGGKIVVTIEGESINQQMELMKKIQDLPDVITVNLSYSYCEDEVAGAVDGLNKIS